MDMTPIGRVNVVQNVSVREHINRAQGPLGAGFSEGVEQQMCARFDTRNPGELLSRMTSLGDNDAPGLRAESIPAPAHKAEDLPRFEEMHCSPIGQPA